MREERGAREDGEGEKQRVEKGKEVGRREKREEGGQGG